MAKKLVSYAIVVVIAFLMALNYQLFVFPNSFAPAGLNGIFTMLQHLFGFKLSYASILLNVPLAAFVYFKVNRPYAARSMIYTLAFSAFLMLLDRIKDRQHKYFDCPKCRQPVRVPRGKGKIAITCPKCKEKFIRKT